jgi:Flp pilus assembly pilin Flp
MLNKLQAALKKLHRDEAGAMSVEKVLILGVIALPILILVYLFVFKKAIPWFQGQQSQLDDPGTQNLQ